ncbi:MAG: ABC transporter permease subunit [Anaerolineae bacterium]|nr:ABC transporter permease subunit [Anaerolineae bacterium]
MTTYLIKRFLLAIPVLLLTALLVFSALHLAGGDPVMLLVHPTAPDYVREAVRAKLGLDKPLPVQFVIYMSNVLRGDLGRSILSRREVSELILEKLPVTVELGVASLVLAYLLSIPLGAIAALNRNSFLDWSSMILALIGVSMPGFWLGLILIFTFAVHFRWFPPTGHASLKHLVLPALALGLPRVGRMARITRSSLLEVVGQDYIRTARAKGLAERAVVLRHALRNALIPIISLMGLDLGYIVGGSVVIEHVFARPGIGDMMLRAIYSRDFPVLQGSMFVLALAIILANIIADVAYVIVDPRIRHK